MFRRDYIVSFDKPLLKICLIWWHLRIQAVQFGRSAQTWPKFLPLPLAAGFVSGQEVIRKVGGSNFECTSGTIRYYNICTWEWRSFHYPHISTLSFLTWWYLISAVVAVHVFVRCLRFPGYMLLVGMEITDLQQHGALRFGSEFQVSPGPLSSGCVVVGLATTATRRFHEISASQHVKVSKLYQHFLKVCFLGGWRNYGSKYKYSEEVQLYKKTHCHIWVQLQLKLTNPTLTRLTSLKFSTSVGWQAVRPMDPPQGPLLAMTVVLAPDTPALQVVGCQTILMVFMAAQVYNWPWKAPILNVVDFVVCFLLSLLVVITGFYVPAVTGEVLDTFQALSMAILVCLLGVVALMILCAVLALFYRAAIGSQNELAIMTVGSTPPPSKVSVDLFNVVKALQIATQEAIDQKVAGLGVYDLQNLLVAITILNSEVSKLNCERLNLVNFVPIFPSGQWEDPSNIARSEWELNHSFYLQNLLQNLPSRIPTTVDVNMLTIQ